MEKLLQVEDQQWSSCQKGLKLMPLPTPDLWHARLEQKAVLHPMNRVKNVQQEHQVLKEQPNANRVAKESSVTKRAPPAKSAQQVPFKIKIHYQVPFARRVQQDSTTTCPVKAHAAT